MQNSTEQIVDEILVMDAQRGHRAAFETLASRWQKRLWWHAYRLTSRSEAAWDITQESWLSILRGLTRLREPDRFGAWAYRIVSNKSWDWLKRNHCESAFVDEMEASPRSATENENRDIVKDVHDVLRRLPPKAQVVLTLHYLEGFGLAEIAGILGIAEGTVKSRLHAARLEFKNLWKSMDRTLLLPISTAGKEKVT